MKLVQHHYGKARVRVMKVRRQGVRHSIKELEVSVMLQGNFEASYCDSDNSLVVATDSMKNTVYILAKEKLGEENEEFGLALAGHFLKTYPQVSRVEIGFSERTWDRMAPDGRQHAHSFLQKDSTRRIAKITQSRTGSQVESGIEDLLILKSTQSGFEGYVKDQFTTLAETKDRIMATSMKATWLYTKAPPSYSCANREIVDAMLAEFAGNYSPSVQVTLYQMGEAALKAAPEISQVSIAMPNKHCLLVNLSPFGLQNQNEIFVPTDEPHGQIEGTISRD